MSLQQSLDEIQSKINQACQKSGRSPNEVSILAVTKTFDSHLIKNAFDLGLRSFGENKVQELLDKKASLPEEIKWHMIGRLQTNKVKLLIGQVALIHSLDREDLFDKIITEAAKQQVKSIDCLLQINVSGEASKAGFSPESARAFLNRHLDTGPVKIVGLMTMAPLIENRDTVREVFKLTRKYFKEWQAEFPQHHWRHLSMGMSGDFEIAIEEGSTMVRLGTALFGKRTYPQA